MESLNCCLLENHAIICHKLIYVYIIDFYVKKITYKNKTNTVFVEWIIINLYNNLVLYMILSVIDQSQKILENLGFILSKVGYSE